jgi:hypothetical protein
MNEELLESLAASMRVLCGTMCDIGYGDQKHCGAFNDNGDEWPE